MASRDQLADKAESDASTTSGDKENTLSHFAGDPFNGLTYRNFFVLILFYITFKIPVTYSLRGFVTPRTNSIIFVMQSSILKLQL